MTIYTQQLLSTKVSIPITNIGSNIKEFIEKKLSFELEGKCNEHGYIKTNTISIINYSSGLIAGDNILFNISYECQVALPAEGMIIPCTVSNVTKAGIKAEVEYDEDKSPIIIFVARDHHFLNNEFSEIKENDLIDIKVLGKRFELNDNYISIIGELQKRKKNKAKGKKKLIIVK